MPQENVEVVRGLVDAMDRRDPDALMVFLRPDVEWDDTAGFPGLAGVYHGREEVRKYFEKAFLELWESFRIEVEEITEAGDGRVFLGLSLTGRGRASGVESEIRAWNVLWLADGKIARRQLFWNRDEALKAAGLQETSPGVPFYEKSWFQGAGAVVALLTAVWAFAGAPNPWDLIDDLLSPDLPASNTQIVLDTSAGMDVPFEPAGTKLKAAADAVGDFAAPYANEGLALRGSGGECEGRGDLLVDFGENQGDDVGVAAANEQPHGNSNLAGAVIAAIDDFSDAERFPDPASPKRVVIFTGTIDNCTDNFAAAISSEVERTGIDAVFQMVGLDVADEAREPLRNLKDQLDAIQNQDEVPQAPPGEPGAPVGTSLYFPNDQADIDEVVQGLKEDFEEDFVLPNGTSDDGGVLDDD